MTIWEKRLFWVAVAVLFVFGIFILRAALAPFIFGIIAAYLLDPLCDFLERRGISRGGAAALTTVGFFLVFALALALILPVLLAESRELIRNLPQYFDAGRRWVMLLAGMVRDNPLGIDTQPWMQRLDNLTADLFQEAVGGLRGLLTGVGGFLDVAATVILAPVIAFYMVRDWDRIIAVIADWVPRPHLPVARRLAQDIDRALGGFIRGQLLVCLALGLFYAAGLSLTGLQYGFAIGLMTGIFSFVPWVGMTLGVALGVGVAIVQFGAWMPVLIVIAVFAVGQILEGYILTPRLVGSRVGLHPVWILFALLAGGALLGFTGVLLAVPVAAICGVMVRFLLARYRAGPLYGQGETPGPDAG